MRCLYCGKELALLKRLTRGEFCSDAHRQQYKEEYNQLALNRLLQAKNQPKASEELETEPVSAKTFSSISKNEPRVNVPSRDGSRIPSGPAGHYATPEIQEPEVVAPADLYIEPVHEAEPAAKDSAEPEPPATAPAGAESVAAEEPAPAGPAGFVIDMPIPVLGRVAQMAGVESDLEHNAKPSLPLRDPAVREITQLSRGQSSGHRALHAVPRLCHSDKRARAGNTGIRAGRAGCRDELAGRRRDSLSHFRGIHGNSDFPPSTARLGSALGGAGERGLRAIETELGMPLR